MKSLIDNKGSIHPHEWFTFLDGKNKGKRLLITETISEGNNIIDCTDRIKNLENNKSTQIKRSVLIDLNPVYDENNRHY